MQGANQNKEKLVETEEGRVSRMSVIHCADEGTMTTNRYEQSGTKQKGYILTMKMQTSTPGLTELTYKGDFSIGKRYFSLFGLSVGVRLSQVHLKRIAKCKWVATKVPNRVM